jgi:amino acid transporter
MQPTNTQVGLSFLVKPESKIHTQTSATYSQAAPQAAMTFVPTSLRYPPLIRCPIHQYAAAMFKILYSYSGWQNANYVLNEVKDPVRTIKIAGPLGLGITSALYIFANVAYFAYAFLSPRITTSPKRHQCSASSKADIVNSGTIVASLFFESVFGTKAQKVLTVFVALRYDYCINQRISGSDLNVHASALGYVPL